jgi:hypothetical protein
MNRSRRRFPALSAVALATLVLLAGCVGAFGASDPTAPRPPTGTPVQGTTPTGDYDPADSVPVQRFASGPSTCGPAPTAGPGYTLTTNASGVRTVTVTGAVAVEDRARYVPPGGLFADARGRYTLWVESRPDPQIRADPCVGHVPYEATFELPADGGSFHLTVIEDGERAAAWTVGSRPPS